MPAAAVIPALIVYIHVAAVKTLVVGVWELEGMGLGANRVPACAFPPSIPGSGLFLSEAGQCPGRLP